MAMQSWLLVNVLQKGLLQTSPVNQSHGCTSVEESDFFSSKLIVFLA